MERPYPAAQAAQRALAPSRRYRSGSLAWDGDPAPYLDVLAPYPMPPSPLRE